MLFLGLKLNLKSQTTKIFAKDVLPGNLIVLGTNIAVILNIVKIKIDCFDWYKITFLSKSNIFKFTSIGITRYDILYI
jgi:hypothetical protein